MLYSESKQLRYPKGIMDILRIMMDRMGDEEGNDFDRLNTFIGIVVGNRSERCIDIEI